MAIFLEDVRNLLNSNIKNRYWTANKMLYNLCAQNPDYRTDINPDSFVMKLWTIGRTYAAAIERRNRVNIRNLGHNDDFAEYAYDFYYDEVYPALNNDYFNILDQLRNINTVDDTSIPVILKAHKILTDIFASITGKEKRSLVSKYLHFHFPKLFFIYDSRANSDIKNYVSNRDIKDLKTSICNNDYEYDKVYYDFYLKCYSLYLNNNHFANDSIDGIERYFTRLLDSVLLVSAARSAQNKRVEMLNELKAGNYDASLNKKIDAAVEVYKSLELRGELVTYLNQDHLHNRDVLRKINKRWNEITDEE